MNAQDILDRHGLRTRYVTRRDLRRLRELFASAFRMTATTSRENRMSRGLISAALADHFLRWRFRRAFGRRRFGKSWFWGRSSAGT